MKYLLEPNDLTIREIDELIEIAKDIIKDKSRYQEAAKHKILATLFFEPSTRTRLSFEAAMLSLGGSVLGFSEASSSSAAKGESVTDTIWTVSCYSDIIAMRHPKEGAPYVAKRRAKVPLINAGDGGHNHPTQTLTDLLTIHREKGKLDNQTIGFVGDLKYGRTVHSLVKAMARYEGTKFVFISPEELRIPDYLKEDLLDVKNIEHKEVRTIEESIDEVDVLYMTRIQRERFSDPEEYLRLKDSYVLDLKKLENSKPDLTIMHPLPRVNEIAVEVDDDPRAKYFDQVENGKFIRMALILKMLGLENAVERLDKTEIHSVINPETQDRIDKSNTVVNVHKCNNPRCITTIEQELDYVFYLADKETNTYRCLYCETKAE